MGAFIDFKALAESIDVEQVAHHCGLSLKRGKDLRSSCPVCKSDERSLALFPETNSWRCFSAGISGDSVALYAHLMGYTGMYKAAKELGELFATPTGARNNSSTTPQKPTGQQMPPPVASTAAAPVKQRQEPFDPTAFAAKLEFSPEVAALGYTEETAAAFRVGVYRGTVYIPNIYPSGTIAGWSKLVDGKLVPPKQWLPDVSNIVHLRRPA